MGGRPDKQKVEVPPREQHRRQKKILEDTNSLEESRRRVDFIFENYDEIFVAFSGGKDSGLLVNLLLDGWERHGGRENPIRLQHVDDEFKCPETDEYLYRLLEDWPDALHMYWCCLPVSYSCQVNYESNSWYPWNEEESHRWIRQLPDLSDYDNAELVTINHEWLEHFDKGDRHYDVACEFITGFIEENDCYLDREAQEGVIQLVGIRAKESMDRYSTIMDLGDWHRDVSYHSYRDAKYSNGYPVYDWADEELWAVHAIEGWDYNETYDRLYELGYALTDMRTAAVFGEMPVRGRQMHRMRKAWPELYEKSERRLDGAHLAFDFGMDIFDPTVPHGVSGWREYANLMLNDFEDEEQQQRVLDTIQGRIDRHWEHSNIPLQDAPNRKEAAGGRCDHCGLMWYDIAKYINAELNGVLIGRI